jgi:hypothetical protein
MRQHPGHGWSGRLWTDAGAVELSGIASVYYRRPTRFRLPDGDAMFATLEVRLGLGGVLTALNVRWVNTLVTNDHAAAVAFTEKIDGPVVCKTLSSLVLAEGGTPHTCYKNGYPRRSRCA